MAENATIWKLSPLDGHFYRLIDIDNNVYLECAPAQIDNTPDLFEGVRMLVDEADLTKNCNNVNINIGINWTIYCLI